MEFREASELVFKLEKENSGRFIKYPALCDAPMAFVVKNGELAKFFWLCNGEVRQHDILDPDKNADMMGCLLAHIHCGNVEYIGKKLQQKS